MRSCRGGRNPSGREPGASAAMRTRAHRSSRGSDQSATAARFADLAGADQMAPDESWTSFHLLEDLADVLADEADGEDGEGAEEHDEQHHRGCSGFDDGLDEIVLRAEQIERVAIAAMIYLTIFRPRGIQRAG